MSRQDSFDIDTEYPFILSESDFEPYIEVKDGHINFERLKDQPSKIAVLASLYNTLTRKHEPFNCVLSYPQYLRFYNSINRLSDAYAVKTKLRAISGEEL